MRRLLVLGFETSDKKELGEIIYFGNDADAAQTAFEDSELYRFQFFQVDRFIKQKFKEDNEKQPQTVEDNGSGEGSDDSTSDDSEDDSEDESGGNSEDSEENGNSETSKKPVVKKAAKKVTRKRAAKKATKKTAKKVARKKAKKDDDLLS